MRVIVSGETSRDALHFRSLLNCLGQQCEATDCVALEHLSLRFATGVPFDLILVRPGDDQAAGLNAIQESKPRAPVLVVGKGDPEFQTIIRRAGARGWIEETRFREQMLAAIDGLYLDKAVGAKRGRLIAVTAAGNAGVTTVSSGVAFALGVTRPDTVGLAELDSGTPELALALDLDFRFSVSSMLADWERMDPSTVRQVAVRHEVGGVSILAHKAETLQAGTMTANQMRYLLVLLREMYGQTVLDLGHSATIAAIEAMQMAESVVVVVRPDVPSLRLGRAYLNTLRDQGVPMERVRLVANRTGHRAEATKEEIERLLGMPPVEWIPDDPDTVIGALGEGRPLIDYSSGAKVTKALVRLAKLLDTVPAK